MKLRLPEIERIVDKLLQEWKTRKLASFRVPDIKVRSRMIDIFVAELRIEDEINQEADKILSKYENQFASGELDRRKMFLMVKNQLVKERKVIL